MNTHRSLTAPSLAAAFALCLMVPPLSAATFGPYTYTENVISITITDYNGGGGALVIPASIAGKPVTAIGDWSFNECYQLTRVTIPSSVTFIGKNAFGFCSGLTRVTIPDSVTYIGDGAFHDCSGLSSLTVPNKITTINCQAFGDCTGLTHVTLPPGVTNISWFAFSGCSSLARVTIPSGVTSIGRQAFYGCSLLTRAVFLGNAPSMEASVFNATGSGFSVHYLQGRTGFTTPTWNGYPCVVDKPAPEISVQQPAGSELVDGKSKRSFGSVKIGKSAAKTFTLRNTGKANLTMPVGISIFGIGSVEYSVTFPSKTSLAPGASISFKVTFHPTAAGTQNAAIIIKSNDANENPFDFKLTGLGVK